MITVVFDPSFDQGHWPGALADRRAAIGELWTGPLGLLNILETMTGLRGPGMPQAVRAASLVPALRKTEGFWSLSAGVDPFGTAEKILSWRDYLYLHGWQGQACAPRLADLARVAVDALPGVPDRLLATCETISKPNNVIAELRMFEPSTELPLIWQRMIQALEQTGTTVTVGAIVPTASRGDLAACRQAPFSPKGDGSLQLLRPLTPGAAAQEAAAWLSGLKDLSRTVIIGPDSTLDAALHRFGLPTTGAGIPVYDNSLLQILPLVLEMAWNPPDPQRALELLTLPVSPIPRGIAFRLVRALQDYPAVGSDAWHQAMDAGLQAVTDRSRRDHLQKRLQSIFTTAINGREFPAAEILRRVDEVRAWSRGRMQADTTAGFDWQPLIAQMENAQRMVSLSGLAHFTAPQIRRLIHDITVESQVQSLYADQAGLAHVNAPECMVGPAENIVWWSFGRDGAPSVFIDPFSQQERQALCDLGVLLPDPGRQAVRNAGRWQRPLLLAEKQLILVCAENGDTNEAQFPHPLWDEIVGRIKSRENSACLQKQEIASATKPKLLERNIAPLPRPETHLHISPSLITQRETESPNSLSALISCPFRWVVTYLGRLSGGLSAALSAPEELEGWFIHEILKRLLERGKQSPEAEARTAVEIFDAQGPFLAARFFLPGHDVVRARVRRNTETAASQIFRMIHQAGFTIAAVEQKYEQPEPSLGVTLEGRPDLVLDNPLAVVDFKRGGVDFRKGEITNGTSVQLAVYGRLLRKRKNSPFPPAAYFMLKAGQLITGDAQAFPEAAAIDDAPPLSDTWQAIETTCQAIRAELEQGDIPISGNQEDAPKKSHLTEGRIYLTACNYCDLGVLCGKKLELSL
ncbi:MAG: PD-(D/E)XK nuclease family protein [Thermodesulfobacteriota bacterium]